MASRRSFLKLGAVVSTGTLVRWQLPLGSRSPLQGAPLTVITGFTLPGAAPFGCGIPYRPAYAVSVDSVQALQTPLPGASIPRFVEPLPTFFDRRVSDASLTVGMVEFQQKVLPDALYAGLETQFRDGTFVWGYRVGDDDNGPSWPGRTVVAQRGRPTTVTYRNTLPADPVLRKYLTIDQTIHWADPLHQHGSFSPYTGPIPTVVHLHGGEDQSTSDGAPEAWFTNNGLHGAGYFTLYPTDPNEAIYQYPNKQQATTLWFHDHALGITRINVFSGLAAFYLIRDQFDTGESDNPLGLPTGRHEIELMIQDRQFDTNGQLLFPDSAANPSLIDGAPGNPGVHPFWIPEFFGDAMVVNGRAWPFLEVEPRRYRFRFVNAANARFVRMGLADTTSGAAGPPIWQIGTDGGLLDRPVKLPGLTEPPATGPGPTTRVFLAPSERADVIIDFAGQAGNHFTLSNDAQVPFPSGLPLDPADPTRQIMQFRVTLPLSGRDTTYNPAGGASLRGGHNQEPAIVRLANPSNGTLAHGVHPSTLRELVLFEAEGPAGQPLEDLINNTRWTGIRDRAGQPPNTPIPGSREDPGGFSEQELWLTELPRVGSTEVWEFLNLTVDAHPIHIHLIQFQLINRQAVAIDPSSGAPTYTAAYAAQFPGGSYAGTLPNGSWGLVTYPPGTIIPGYGPPNKYDVPNADKALGGNLAFSPFLSGPVLPPAPSEAGWKDTIKVFPGFVNRFAIRWAPQAIAVSAVQPGQNLFSFDPTQGPGYVVHCHILDHEDNEMMRPYLPVS